ncbi:signal peptidase I [Bianquea renquensis]|uniref:Signal peptidase I n=1 Tax=Bianquea renquensis TaxID=2763661 RepID=A0A926DWD1_9FIRM|nr:signal peptidase I [Bianquea renquensis]MBC8545291.1 signal peptidase I [Bianquea renquensis]
MRDEQEQSIKEKASPPREDPRIDVLIGAYRNLAVKVDLLQEQIQEQEKELTRQKDSTVDAILTELHQEKEQGAFPSTSHERAPMPDNKPEAKEEPVGQESKPQHSASAKAGPKKGRAGKIIGECVFYGLLLLLILSAVFVRTTSDGSPRSLAGYSGMIVLTESMQSEIPKGSLVITKTVDPQSLQIGDDITYMANQTTSVTHRIVGITENYENTGQRAFQTQGIMNREPDKQMVPAVNVVGKVVFHSEVLGTVASFIGQYWPFLLFILAVAFVLLYVLRRIFKSPPEGPAKH